MIVTEQEARTKVCPAMSAQLMHPAGVNQSVTQKCLASQCMKWRWGTYKSPLEIKNRKELHGMPDAEPQGYCDL